jgi:hypothetical protein
MPGKYRRIGITVPETTTEHDAHNVIGDTLRTGVLGILDTFEDPDDDWDPVWMVLTRTQGTILAPGPGVEKYEMTAAVAALARRWSAIAVGHLHSSWIVFAEDAGQQAMKDYIDGGGGSTEGLARRECLLLASYTASRAINRVAYIHRHEQAPPTLGPFEVIIDTSRANGENLAGAMVEPFLEALQRVG